MLKRITIFATLIFSCVNMHAQTENSGAPVKWERYKISEREISVELPKMPVSKPLFDDCNQTEGAHYAVYAEQTVYQLTVASKAKGNRFPICSESKKFGSATFEDNIQRLKKTLENVEKTVSVEQTKLAINGKEVTKLSGKFTAHWVFDDLKNNKWAVLSISNRGNNFVNEKQLINSLEFGKNSSGIEIGNGAPQTLGDAETADENKSKEISGQSGETGSDESLLTVFKPLASYTETARKKQTTGTVMLSVTFLANGGIGSVEPVTTLPNGLTEQAIAAAKRIVFLPQIVKGKPVNVNKKVQYSFNIY